MREVYCKCGRKFVLQPTSPKLRCHFCGEPLTLGGTDPTGKAAGPNRSRSSADVGDTNASLPTRHPNRTRHELLDSMKEYFTSYAGLSVSIIPPKKLNALIAAWSEFIEQRTLLGNLNSTMPEQERHFWQKVEVVYSTARSQIANRYKEFFSPKSFVSSKKVSVTARGIAEASYIVIVLCLSGIILTSYLKPRLQPPIRPPGVAQAAISSRRLANNELNFQVNGYHAPSSSKVRINKVRVLDRGGLKGLWYGADCKVNVNGKDFPGVAVKQQKEWGDTIVNPRKGSGRQPAVEFTADVPIEGNAGDAIEVQASMNVSMPTNSTAGPGFIDAMTPYSKTWTIYFVSQEQFEYVTQQQAYDSQVAMAVVEKRIHKVWICLLIFGIPVWCILIVFDRFQIQKLDRARSRIVEIQEKQVETVPITDYLVLREG